MGIFCKADKTYLGFLKNNKPNGLGVLILPSGDVYRGFFKDKKP